MTGTSHIAGWELSVVTDGHRVNSFRMTLDSQEVTMRDIAFYAESGIMTHESRDLDGASREDLRAFPADARRQAGYQLNKVQRGLEAEDWKPLKTVGQSVRELRIRESSGAFRIVYVATLPKGVYVLHCFQKKTQRTSHKDIRLATLRFKAILGDAT